jgi:hypothetical protein
MLNGKRWLQLQDTEEEFGDAKGVINIRKLNTNRQHNGQQKKDKQPSTKYTYKAKDLVTRTPLEAESKRKCSERVSSSCSISDTSWVYLVAKPVIISPLGFNGVGLARSLVFCVVFFQPLSVCPILATVSFCPLMYDFSLHPLISENVSEHIKSYCIFKIYFPDDTIAQSEIPFTCPVCNHCLYLSNIQDGRQDIRRSCNMDIFREYVTKK